MVVSSEVYLLRVTSYSYSYITFLLVYTTVQSTVPRTGFWSPPISVIDSLQITIVLPNSPGKESSHLQPYHPDLTSQRNLDKTGNTNRDCVVNKSPLGILGIVAEAMFHP